MWVHLVSHMCVHVAKWVCPGGDVTLLQVMGVKDASEYLYVACPNDKCWLPPTPKDKWGEQPVKECSCGHAFFQEKPRSNGTTEWEPAGQVCLLSTALHVPCAPAMIPCAVLKVSLSTNSRDTPAN